MACVATLNGFFREEVEQAPGQPFFVDFGCFTGLNACLSYFCWPPCSERCRKTFRTMSKQTSVPVTIHDARQKEQEEGLSKRAFFERHGFVVLKHPTTMSAQDWLSSSATPTSVNVATEEETAVRKIYAKELESVIKELIPKTTEIHFPSRALRRGPGGPNPFYGTGVHQDFGLEPEDLASVSQKFSGLSFDDWNRKLRDGSGRGFSVINFWRPVLPMNGPVKDTPLALCDPNHVEVNQVVTQEVFGFDEKGMISLGLKTSSNHCWYYYPDMTKDEVLVFRQFHHDTTATGAKPLQTVFHSAFKHPKAAGSEPRCSSEYRVGVWWKS